MTVSIPQTPGMAAVTVVFVDLKHKPIAGLAVKITTASKSEEAITQADGTAIEWTDAKKGEILNVYVKKKNDTYELKTNTNDPKKNLLLKFDVNNFTICSPEIHIEAMTHLDAKAQEEEILNIPTIQAGEVLTADKLFNELAPYIGSARVVTEKGQITKDYPTKKPVEVDGKKTIEMEHHFKVVKTEKPKTIVFEILGQRVNYPNSIEITDAKLTELAALLKCEKAAIIAVTETETKGNAYLANGLPPILFERHYFYQLTDPNNKSSSVNPKEKHKKIAHPYAKYSDICNVSPGGYGPGAIHQYERLIKAGELDRDAAIMSCSWGVFQVMGIYYKQFGYATPSELVNKCMASFDGQAELFAKFCLMPEKKKALQGLQEKDWEKFATGYNGGNWRQQNPYYADTMKANYENSSKK